MSWLADTDMISCTKDGHQMPPRDPFLGYPGLSVASATPSTPQIFTIDSRRTKILGLTLAHDEKEVFWLTVEVSLFLSATKLKILRWTMIQPPVVLASSSLRGCK